MDSPFSGGAIFDQGQFNDAQVHIERAKLHAVDNAYLPACVMYLQALVWYNQHRVEEVRSEALCAAEVYEKLRAALWNIRLNPDWLEETESFSPFCEFLQMALFLVGFRVRKPKNTSKVVRRYQRISNGCSFFTMQVKTL